MPRPIELYLDVETDWSRNLTVVGFESRETGLVQFVGSEITRNRVHNALPKTARLFTFNGHAFDLTCIRNQLGLNLRERFESRDLRWVCHSNGYEGGRSSSKTSSASRVN